MADQSGARAAQAALGHQSIQTTEKYLHNNPARLRAAVNALPSFSQPPAGAAPSETWRQVI
jgi:integrase